MAEENGLILRRIYVAIRDKFKDYAQRWNAIWRIWNDVSPSEYRGVWTVGNKGVRIRMYDTIPVNYRYTNKKDYSGQANEINQNVSEESSRIHTLGNENNIRRSTRSLNDITHQYIGASEGYTKISVNNIGQPTSVNISALGVKKYSELSNNPNDVFNGQQLLTYPSDTAKVNYIVDSSNSAMSQNGVYTFDVNAASILNNDEIVKKSDYEHIETVLARIKTCLDKKNSWFSGGICSRYCQVQCQNRCQLSCQGCNTKQCHNQKCGAH